MDGVRKLVGKGVDVNGTRMKPYPKPPPHAIQYIVEVRHPSLTPLACAAQRGDLEMVRFLLDHGASPTAATSDSPGNPDSWTRKTALYHARGEHVTEILRLLLQTNPHEAAVSAALVHAAQVNDAESIRVLLDHGVNETGRQRALEMARRFDRRDGEVEKMLRAAGAVSPNLQLDEAAKTGDVERIRALLGRADTAGIDHACGTAISHGQEEAAIAMLPRASDLAAANYLTSAAGFDRAEVVRHLVARCRRSQAKHHFEPNLHRAMIQAAQDGKERALGVLLDSGADINHVQTAGGRTALMSAAWNGHADTVRLLLARGADRNMRDNKGRTAIDLAREIKNEEIVRILR
jgi:hypothetical protein